MFESQGKLHYSIGEYHKLIVQIDPEIVRYYRSMMPKYVQSQPQMYRPHISVIRHDDPKWWQLKRRWRFWRHWGKYEGELIKFNYDGVVHEGTVYYWLNCFCSRLEEIRVELGLPIHSQYTQPPEGFTKVFHCTIGNKKGLK
jgi:hypothetical protein